MARRPKKKDAAPRTLGETIIPTDLTQVMRSSYQDYAAAVVIGRAIPDVRDGLKPVHRRILYAMLEGGYDWTTGYRKSARVVGDVIGKYHPHGDTAVYDAMARLTQPWSLTTPLIDGQGNFGSPDGDRPAAMRYTEARLGLISKYMLNEIRQDTVDFQPNYDQREQEPLILPSRFPNILVNGGSGIAVGLASSIPPHNFAEVINATRWRLANPQADLEDALAILPAPDFPTGGQIIGLGGPRKAYETGRGNLVLEATMHQEMDGKTPVLVYTEMPWGSTKPAIYAKISELMRDNKLPEVVAARDESDRNGVRFVVELQPDADPERVDARLKTLTGLRVPLSMNFTVLDGTGVPREMGMLEILDRWIAFRQVTLRRRSTFELRKARDRGRLLFGRIMALSIIDRVIALIRKSASPSEAIEELLRLTFKRADFDDLVDLMGTETQKRGKTFNLSRTQAEDILALRLSRLTGLEREALAAEGKSCAAEVARLSYLLNTPGKIHALLDEELVELLTTPYAQPRKSTIRNEAPRILHASKAPESLLPKLNLWVAHTHDGALGRSAKEIAFDPAIHSAVYAANTYSRLVFFSTRGTAYGIEAANLPDLDAKNGEPRLLSGLLGYSLDGPIVATHLLKDPSELTDDAPPLVFVSRDSMARRTALSEFTSIPSAGKVAMKLKPEDADIIAVISQGPDDADLLLATKKGKTLRFSLDDVRVFAGRSSRGVAGMKLDKDDSVVAALLLPAGSPDAAAADAVETDWTKGKTINGPVLIQLCATGHAKRTPAGAWRTMGRGGKGINDKGPAKTIGDIIDVVLSHDDTESLYWPDTKDTVPVASVKRTGKASTGGKPLEKITTKPLLVPERKEES